MGAVTSKPLTIAEFDKLDLPEDRHWELHNGELVEVPFPTLVHKHLQQRITDLLRSLFPTHDVLEEYPFQIEASKEKRSADVGLTTRERLQASLKSGILIGSPELVVEVLSPSNGILELKGYRRLCLEHGTLAFWIVDPEDNTVEVHLKDGRSGQVYEAGQEVPVALFGAQKIIAVTAVFSGITTPAA